MLKTSHGVRRARHDRQVESLDRDVTSEAVETELRPRVVPVDIDRLVARQVLGFDVGIRPLGDSEICFAAGIGWIS